MDGRIFARFHLDAGVGDVVMRPLETIACRDWLGFAGIESAGVPMIAREQQFAEKIHAYTLPRNAANSRVKDLVDLALLIGSSGLDKQRIMDALRLIFERRGTHDCRRGWFHRQQIGRFRFTPWRRSVGSRQMPPRCLRAFRSSLKKCWHKARRAERGMTENRSDSLPFEPPEQENVRVSARTMPAGGGFWQFTAFLYRNFRQRIHLQPKPSSRRRGGQGGARRLSPASSLLR